jgi:hypothetical protein
MYAHCGLKCIYFTILISKEGKEKSQILLVKYDFNTLLEHKYGVQKEKTMNSRNEQYLRRRAARR